MLEAIVPVVYTVEIEAKTEEMALSKAIKNSKISDFSINHSEQKIPLRSSRVEEVTK